MQHAIIIIPTYNERGSISSLIIALEKVIKEVKGFYFNILVVDDNSPDDTADVVRELSKKYSNILLLEGKKKGLGAAYIRGMHYAIDEKGADVVVEMDADGQHPPKLLINMFEQINSGADFVIGSRYIKGGSIPKDWGIHRKIYSHVGNLIVRLGLVKLRVRDWTSGYRAIRAHVFEKVSRGLGKYSGYTFQVAFLDRVESTNFTIVEVPLRFAERKHGDSKIIPLHYIKNLLLYIFLHSTFIKYGIVGVIGFTIQALIAKLFVFFNLFPGIAVGIGAFTAIIANFIGNNLWTFSHKRIRGVGKLLNKFIHFLITSIGALVIQIVVVSVGVLIFGEDAWFWFMIFAIAFLVIPYNYIIYKRFIWKTHEKQE